MKILNQNVLVISLLLLIIETVSNKRHFKSFFNIHPIKNDKKIHHRKLDNQSTNTFQKQNDYNSNQLDNFNKKNLQKEKKFEEPRIKEGDEDDISEQVTIHLPMDTPPPEEICKPELLITAGFDMRVEPIYGQTIEMCPKIQTSCCTREDQVKIYQNWVYNQEGKNMDERFEWYESTYEELFKALKRANTWVEKVDFVLQKTTISNCKIFTKKLSQMQIDVVMPKLIRQTKFMFEYFATMYKGMYCAICDAKLHKYFDLDKKEIIINKKACRQQITETIYTIYYFFDLINDYINMMLQFLGSCDYKGEFEKYQISEKYKFWVSQTKQEKIERCFKYLNTVDWFQECSFICERVNYTKWNLFFSPLIKKYSRVTIFINKTVDEWDKTQPEYEYHLKVKNLGKGPKKRYDRILAPTDQATSSTDNKNSTTDQNKPKTDQNSDQKLDPAKIEAKNKEKKFKDLNLFKFGMNPLVQIDKMKKKIQTFGLDLYKVGKSSIYLQDIYKKLEKEFPELFTSTLNSNQSSTDKLYNQQDKNVQNQNNQQQLEQQQQQQIQQPGAGLSGFFRKLKVSIKGSANILKSVLIMISFFL